MPKKLDDKHFTIYNKQEIKKNNKIQSSKNMFVYAMNGLKIAFLEESNMKIHCFVAVLIGVISYILKLTFIEWMIVILCITLIFILEMINTAIENIIDFISPEYHQLAGKIKDIGSGAVLVGSIGVAVIGIILFLSKII